MSVKKKIELAIFFLLLAMAVFFSWSVYILFFALFLLLLSIGEYVIDRTKIKTLFLRRQTFNKKEKRAPEDVQWAMDVLGIENFSFSKSELKRKYKEMAKIAHPDAGRSSPISIYDVNKAYEILKTIAI